MEKDLIKYDGIEFSLPLAVTDKLQSYLQYYFFNCIGRIFLLVNIFKKKKR
jgi:hypothetical protein